VPMPAVEPNAPSVTEHTIVVRALDRFENVGVAKTVLNAPAADSSH